MGPEFVSPDEAAQVPAIVPINFWRDHEPDKEAEKADPENAGKFKAVDWVEYAKKGTNGSTTVEKIDRIKNKLPVIWGVVEPYYENWLKGQEEPEDGTPLSAWPGCTRAVAEHLKSIHIRTVEDVAMLTDADLERVGMGARDIQKRAQAYVEAQQDHAKTASIIEAATSENEDLKAQIEELTKTVQQLTADKPKRGKPKDAAA